MHIHAKPQRDKHSKLFPESVRLFFLFLELTFSFYLKCHFASRGLAQQRGWLIHQHQDVSQGEVTKRCSALKTLRIFYTNGGHVDRWATCYVPVHVCVFLLELDPYAAWDRAVWDVCMHNSVCHSYLNEERRKWDPQRAVGVKKCESLFMAASMCRRCVKRWQEQEKQITVCSHLTPGAINDMLKHWRHSETWARLCGGRLNPIVFQMQYAVYMVYFSLSANQTHKSN